MAAWSLDDVRQVAHTQWTRHYERDSVMEAGKEDCSLAVC